MKALITGASSGIGRDMAHILHAKGIELWLVARREDRLRELKDFLGDSVHILALDLGNEENCHILYNELKDKDIDIVINNAGFGQFGFFTDVALDRELEMIDLNIRAPHILTKLFLRDFEERGSGYILNVASSAAFLPGPLMSVYYSTKAYLYRLTLAIYEELRRKDSRVYVGVLCPGPVETEFNSCAGVRFSIKSLTSMAVARYAIEKMFKKKLVIVPGLTVRLGTVFQRLVPTKLLLKISYHIQHSKEKG
ncbi:MAG: SDR family oxidoreductase [Ruminococcaceae bacterium]|nr:SDR family oxidoreductase [Oscillospiraceae bacterium]